MLLLASEVLGLTSDVPAELRALTPGDLNLVFNGFYLLDRKGLNFN